MVARKGKFHAILFSNSTIVMAEELLREESVIAMIKSHREL